MRDATDYADISVPITDQAGKGTSTWGPLLDRIPPERGAGWCPSLYWTAPVPFDPAAPVAGANLEAFINEGRLIASCPDCAGAQLTATDDPRFMCVDCGNAANKGAWRPVTFPQALPEIIAVLEVRDDVADQSWTPDKTIEDLAAENVELGVGVDVPVDVPVDIPVDVPVDEPGPAMEPAPNIEEVI